MEPAQEHSSGIRLAELMATLSIATDLGMGQPLEFAMQSCLVAMRLGEKLGFSEPQLRGVYYQSLLRYIGCNAETHLLAAIFGDELTLRKDIIHADPAGMDFMRQAIRAIQAADPARSPFEMLQAIAGGMMEASRMTAEFYAGHCEVAERLSTRLGFDAELTAILSQVYARWDGKGVPALKGEEIAPGMLVVSLAQDVLYTFRLLGLDAATAMVKSRKGSLYAPKHVEVFCDFARELLEAQEISWEGFLALEPGSQEVLSEARFESACEAIADYVDIKSPFLLGHSTGVSRLAASAGQRYGLPGAEIPALRRAALLHDIGRVGVSAGIWGKTGRLNSADWEKIRLHPYYTERILSHSPKLAAIGRIASLNHERMDGSGYHRGLNKSMLSAGARLLAAADVYQALTEARPQRSALAPDVAAEELQAQARAGLLEGDAVRAVLACGDRQPARRKETPGGLSEREIEVLCLIARGYSIRAAAQALSIAPKTVDSHIQHIYTKIDVKTRAGAALYAMEHHLL